MVNRLISFLESSAIAADLGDITTTSNVFLDENGQFEDVSQVADNINSLWMEMDIIGKITAKLPTIIIAVVLIVLGIFVSRFIAKIAVKAMQARGIDPSVYNFIKRIISVGIKAAFFLSALSMFININSLIAAIGAAGVTAGLGLQSSVAQFASGIQLLVNRPFKSGDFVEVNGVAGSVVDVRFMQTIINTPDNKRIIIPNSHITTNHIINYTAENKRRVDLNYSISYSDDISHAKRVITEVANANPYIMKDPAIQVFVGSHDASSINLVTRLWCKGEDYWNVYFAMQEEVKLAFDKNGICIPFNQLDVHIKND